MKLFKTLLAVLVVSVLVIVPISNMKVAASDEDLPPAFKPGSSEINLDETQV